MTHLAQALYEAYCNHTGWKSLVSGADLPVWDDLKPEIKNAWQASANICHPIEVGSYGWAISLMMSGSFAIRKFRGYSQLSREELLLNYKWVIYSPGKSNLPHEGFFSSNAREYAKLSGGSATVNPAFMTRNEDGTIGYYTPTTEDILAKDWIAF